MAIAESAAANAAKPDIDESEYESPPRDWAEMGAGHSEQQPAPKHSGERAISRPHRPSRAL